MKRMPTNRQTGFSLLELMVTLAVAAILVVIAFPSMRDFMRRNHVVAQSNGIQSDLQLARGQAAATRGYVSICPLATAGTTTCDTSATSYDLGWLVYTSSAPNSAYASATDELEHVGPVTDNITVRVSNGGVLTYNSRGELIVGGNSTTSASFKTCAKVDSSDSLGASTSIVPGIQLAVANSGRIASSKLDAGADCGY